MSLLKNITQKYHNEALNIHTIFFLNQRNTILDEESDLQPPQFLKARKTYLHNIDSPRA